MMPDESCVSVSTPFVMDLFFLPSGLNLYLYMLIFGWLVTSFFSSFIS